MSLKRNCLNLLQRIVGADNFSFSAAGKTGRLFGRTVWLEGANDERSESKIRGMTLGGAYCDELTMIPRGFYQMLLSRLSEDGARLYATTNPDSPGHWVMEDLILNDRIDLSLWEFALSDNIFLNESYTKNIASEYAGVFYDRFVLGKWAAAEGLIYRQVAEDARRFTADLTDRSFGIISAGVDFGGTRSGHAFCAVGITEGFGELAVLRSERHFGEIDPERLNGLVIEFLREVKEKYGEVSVVYCDNAEPVLIRGLKKAIAAARPGVRVLPAAKTRIKDRIRITLTLMAQGRLKFAGEGCAALIRAMSEALWSSRGDVRLDDRTRDVDSLDAFEYAWERYGKYLV